LTGGWPERLAAFLFGSCFGSFANVLIYRLPLEQSIVKPRSRCPNCHKTIAWHDNIPVWSWIFLGGRCRNCRKTISARYPLVEAACGALAAGLWARWGQQGEPVWAACVTLAACALVAVTLIDWDTFIIPDELSLGLWGAGLLLAPLNPYMGGPWYAALGWSAFGSLAGFLMCWGVAVVGEKAFGKEAMGGGDIKLLAAVGAWSGALGAFDCLMVGSLLGAAYGVSQIAGKKLKRSDPIPFGPFLSAGAVFNFFFVLPLGFPFS
jgi:leader peptidase (prepilin peptidase)/N-methyltransferase